MKNRIVYMTALSLLLTGGLVSIAEEPGVIQHHCSCLQSLRRSSQKKIFQICFSKKVKQWKESGEAVLPIDLIEDSSISRPIFRKHPWAILFD